MPGSKRRALKNLLSPHHGAKETKPIDIPDAHSHSQSPSSPINGHLEPSSASLHSQQLPPSAASSAELQALNDMEQRQGAIGTSAASHLQTSRSPSNGVLSPGSLGEDRVESPNHGTYTVDDLLNAGPDGKEKKKSSKQRFAEREARKKEAMIANSAQVDPNETARLEKEKAEEADIIGNTCRELGVELHEINADGHCMYSAIADQLYILGLLRDPAYQNTRHAAAIHLRENKDSFMPFVPSIMGEDMAGAVEQGGSEKVYAEYCKRVEQSGDWGGEIEIQALSRYFNVPIHVIQRGPPFIISHSPNEDASNGAMTAKQSLAAGKAVRISYHKRMYGLGEHYNSLRPVRA